LALFSGAVAAKAQKWTSALMTKLRACKKYVLNLTSKHFFKKKIG
tara:strand:- start:775 stop:909 length:135 start_codon:yes stop_codon:yes gene_type:complete